MKEKYLRIFPPPNPESLTISALILDTVSVTQNNNKIGKTISERLSGGKTKIRGSVN